MRSPDLNSQAVDTTQGLRQERLAQATVAADSSPRPPESARARVRGRDRARSVADDLPELITAKQLEAVTQINVKTIYGYVRRGLIPYVRIQSNVRFRREEIRNWIERNSFRPR